MSIGEEIKQSKFKNAQQKAIINLIYTTNWLLHKQQLLLKPYGITPQQFNILRILKGQHPKSISATEIKLRMLDKNSDVSRLLDRLIQKQLIVKQTCSQDKRAMDVFISETGIDLLKTLDKEHKKFDHMLPLSEEESLLLSDLLDKCRVPES